MAVSSSVLRRLLTRPLPSASSSATLQWNWPFSATRHRFSSAPDGTDGNSTAPASAAGDAAANVPTSTISKLFGDDGPSNLPPLTTPKLFVSGLSRMTTDEKLKEAFGKFGRLIEAKVITDRISGRSKGFGFVTYASIEEADKAREGMNAKFLDGWVIFVDPAKPREPRPAPQPQTEPSEMGFRTNKTIGWCG